MDAECVSYIVGAAISGIGLGYPLGWKIGKSKIVAVMPQKCGILHEEINRLRKENNVMLKIVPTQVETIGGKTTRVDCSYCDHSTKKCSINDQRCRFFE
jgi:hypothetical protein